MRRAKIRWSDVLLKWVVTYNGPGVIDYQVPWLTWGAAIASAVEWVDFR